MARGKPTTQPVKAPDYVAWHVTSKGEKSFSNKVGAAWAHKDGKGYTLQLETCPINGRIVLARRLKMHRRAKLRGAN